jgi:NAD(P)-dependent dehydrogenase (short-subunit alcohol dehydrogenase family)
MAHSSFLITGAGRGIGLELTKQLVKVDQVSKIIATFRGKPSDALSKLAKESSGRVISVPCDVSSPESIEKAVPLISSELDNKGLDVLVNVVGVSCLSAL